jgi:hypothetical protein
MTEIINKKLYSPNTLWSITKRVNAEQGRNSLDLAKKIRKDINGLLYDDANRGKNYSLIFMDAYAPDDTNCCITKALINLLKEEGFDTSYSKGSCILTVRWGKEE